MYDGNEDALVDAVQRQADAMETLSEEVRYQNAVLTELARGVRAVAVASNEYSSPDEKPEHVPSLKGMAGNIDDHRLTREEWEERL